MNRAHRWIATRTPGASVSFEVALFMVVMRKARYKPEAPVLKLRFFWFTVERYVPSLTLFEVALFMVVMREHRHKPEAPAREKLSLAGASGL